MTAMNYIHEQPGWPHLTWDSETLSALLASIRHQQGFLLGQMSALGFEMRAEASLEMMTANIVKSSEIEGEILNRDDVRSSIARHLNLDMGGVSPINRHIEGIVEMMLDATQRCQQPLTKDRLFGWHSALFPTGWSSMRKITVAAWRPPETQTMQVVSGAIGRERVHFEAPSPERLDKEMTLFLDWFNQDETVDPVLKAGIAHFWFVTIHPFEDGNGRMARAIADLALARADGISDRFYSMSTQIEHERKAYYTCLETSQKGTLDITHWLKWFLACLGRAIAGAEDALQAVLYQSKVWDKVNHYAINDRQRKVIRQLLEGFRSQLTTSKYASLAKCSQDTALRDIRELIHYQILIQNPEGGRNTSYQLALLDN